jgi:hypothetical protein
LPNEYGIRDSAIADSKSDSSLKIRPIAGYRAGYRAASPLLASLALRRSGLDFVPGLYPIGAKFDS